MTLELSDDEALVLFEWICEIDKREHEVYSHPAEQRVVWAIEALLEKALVAPLDREYERLLDEARKRVVEDTGG